MATKVLVPLLGEGVEEVTVTKWLKQEGELDQRVGAAAGSQYRQGGYRNPRAGFGCSAQDTNGRRYGSKGRGSVGGDWQCGRIHNRCRNTRKGRRTGDCPAVSGQHANFHKPGT